MEVTRSSSSKLVFQYRFSKPQLFHLFVEFMVKVCGQSLSGLEKFYIEFSVTLAKMPKSDNASTTEQFILKQQQYNLFQ